MKLLKYVVVHDTGLAPNPFWDYCTLAVCTPNHMNARLDLGDWIVGHSTKDTGNKLIYAMEVNEILSFDEYFNDKRFQKKKPKKGSYMNYIGDNIYYRNSKNEWIWIPYSLHSDKRKLDTDHPRVFISKNFYYFGSNSIKEFRKLFPNLIKGEQGFSYERDIKAIDKFTSWLKKHHKAGRNNNMPTHIIKDIKLC
ncbi:MAG TPA: hypothetical protein PKA90_13705 [Ignavibacteria bacterium]|nr:hypothetical protein [Ignavibacteria bacterium]HMR41474.1 hypothetical protein [Ignavibacteria bacterium]